MFVVVFLGALGQQQHVLIPIHVFIMRINPPAAHHEQAAMCVLDRYLCYNTAVVYPPSHRGHVLVCAGCRYILCSLWHVVTRKACFVPFLVYENQR